MARSFPASPSDPLETAAWLRWSLIALAGAVMLLLVVLPLAMVLAAAFAKGIGVWFAALVQPDARAALRLTLFTAAIVLPINAGFGLLMAWALTRFEFRGKRVLLSLIDLPFAVSPVVAGLCLVLLFGSDGWFAEWLAAHDIKILFARPGIGALSLALLFGLYNLVSGTGMVIRGMEVRSANSALKELSEPRSTRTHATV